MSLLCKRLELADTGQRRVTTCGSGVIDAIHFDFDTHHGRGGRVWTPPARLFDFATSNAPAPLRLPLVVTVYALEGDKQGRFAFPNSTF
jgi:hypothetical protein